MDGIIPGDPDLALRIDNLLRSVRETFLCGIAGRSRDIHGAGASTGRMPFKALRTPNRGVDRRPGNAIINT
jgi:hypothetical protein